MQTLYCLIGLEQSEVAHFLLLEEFLGLLLFGQEFVVILCSRERQKAPREDAHCLHRDLARRVVRTLNLEDFGDVVGDACFEGNGNFAFLLGTDCSVSWFATNHSVSADTAEIYVKLEGDHA